MKSQAEHMVVAAFAHLLVDVTAHVTIVSKGYVDWRGHSVPACWQRDLSHLDALLSRWSILDVFSINLPDLGKYLDLSLDREFLQHVRPPLGGRTSRLDARPSFLRILWQAVFEANGRLKADPCVNSIAALRQLLYFAKKVKVDCTEDRNEKALKEFVDIDRQLPAPHPGTFNSSCPKWRSRLGHPLWQEKRDSDGTLTTESYMSSTGIEWSYLRAVARLVLSSFPSLDVWSLQPKHGPGAVSEQVVFKYDLRAWPQRLDSVFPADWFATHDLKSRVQSYREYPARVLCVPKTQKGPRIIAAEQSALQYMQGAIERYLSKAIEGSHIGKAIHLRDQTYSQRLALEGSKNGSFATIDLSAASDRLSCRLAEYIFQSRKDLLDALWATRNMRFAMPDGSVHLANKFAMMGSACTFPVQSICFTILALTAIMWNECLEVNTSNVRGTAARMQVFGDDIIIPQNAYEHVVALIGDCGLMVSATKSFGSGMFRESCGLDAFAGVDVTPAYLSKTYAEGNPESLDSVVATSNNFFKKAYWHTADLIVRTLPRKIVKHFYVGPRDVGVLALFSYFEEPRPRKWNKDLHVYESRYLSVLTKTKRYEQDGMSMLLQFHMDNAQRMGSPTWIDTVYPLLKRVGQLGRPKHRLLFRWETTLGS